MNILISWRERDNHITCIYFPICIIYNFNTASLRFQDLSLNINNVMPVAFVILWAYNHTDYLEDIIVLRGADIFKGFQARSNVPYTGTSAHRLSAFEKLSLNAYL